MSIHDELAALEKQKGVIDPKPKIPRNYHRVLRYQDSKGVFYHWSGSRWDYCGNCWPDTALAIRTKQAWDYIISRVEWFSLGCGHDKMWKAVLDIEPDHEPGQVEEVFDTEAVALAWAVEAVTEYEKEGRSL